MIKKSTFILGIFTVALFLSLAVGFVSAAPVTQNITYQGKLTDAAGNLLTGTYDITFGLFDVVTGGRALETDTRSVKVTNGLFTTPITFDSAFFDGGALWVGIKIGSDPEMTPRQEIRPVPYALGLRPGAIIAGSGIIPVLDLTKPDNGGMGLNVTTSGFGSTGVNVVTNGQQSAAVHAIAKGPQSNAVVGETSADGPAAVAGVTSGNGSYGLYAKTTGGPNSHGVYAVTSGQQSAAVRAIASGPGSNAIWGSTSLNGPAAIVGVTTGIGSPAIYGESTQGTGVFGIGKEGGFFKTNSAGTSVADSRPGVNVSTLYNYNPGVSVMTDGAYSDGIKATTFGDYSHGVDASTFGKNSHGMESITHNSKSLGIHAISYGSDSNGVLASTYGSGSPAVLGVSAQDVGVYGIGREGGYFETNAGGDGSIFRPGVNVSTSFDFNPGVRSQTSGDFSFGVYSSTIGLTSPSVAATTEGKTSDGVSSNTHGDDSYGVKAFSSGSGSHAIWAKAMGPASNGVVAFSNQSPAIWAQTYRSDNKYGLQTPNIIRALNYETGSSDVAEYMPIYGEVSPGTVLVIGPEGKLHPSATAYDNKVAGIISTAPGVSLGAKEVGNPGEELVAVAGRVPCNVDANYGSIQAGDLLTTSDNPGYAMKATDPKIGTIIGKAMGTLESGTGTIEVLVTLQ
jgi:hypothetical protein